MDSQKQAEEESSHYLLGRWTVVQSEDVNTPTLTPPSRPSTPPPLDLMDRWASCQMQIKCLVKFKSNSLLHGNKDKFRDAFHDFGDTAASLRRCFHGVVHRDAASGTKHRQRHRSWCWSRGEN